MNTSTLARKSFVNVALWFAGVAIIASSFFAVTAQRAQAAALTEPQIQAILNLLVAFNVPAATVSNVSVILHKTQQPSY